MKTLVFLSALILVGFSSNVASSYELLIVGPNAKQVTQTQLPVIEYSENYSETFMLASHGGGVRHAAARIITAPLRVFHNGRERRMERRSSRGGLFGRLGSCGAGGCN